MARKSRGFWKRPQTVEVLTKYADGEMTVEAADATLGGVASEKFTAKEVLDWYANRYRTIKTTVKLDGELYEKISTLAAIRGESFQQIVVNALREYLERQKKFAEDLRAATGAGRRSTGGKP